jgi:hypothetical protein
MRPAASVSSSAAQRTRQQQPPQLTDAASASTASSFAAAAADTASVSAAAVSDQPPSAKRRRTANGQAAANQRAPSDKETEQTESSIARDECEPAEDDFSDRPSNEPVAAMKHVNQPQHHKKQLTNNAAATPPHVIGPIAGCDLDSLSVVLSLLSSDDFLSAIRVNKQFYAARLKKSAWPALQLDSFIQSLRDDDYDNSARRRLRLRIPHDSWMRKGQTLLAHASAVFRSVTWRFVTDVQIYSPHDCRLSAPSVDLLLSELARLPCLTAVSFHEVNVSAAAFHQFCIAVAPQLQVLLFESARVDNEVDPLTHVGLLHQLRVLVANELPPASPLLQLHQLEYLHVSAQLTSEQVSPFAAVVRHLSSSHALRSLSFGAPVNWFPAEWFSTTEPVGLRSAAGGAYAALVDNDWSQPIQLTDLSCAAHIGDALLQRCSAIPTLTRLQARTASYWDPSPPPPLSVFTRLQQLRLELSGDKLLPHLAQCNQLRVLQMRFCTPDAVRAESLCAIVAANAAMLEELRFCIVSPRYSLASALAEDAVDADKWSVLATCMRLRVLELPLDRSLSSHVLHALAKIPAFQSLELALTKRQLPRSASVRTTLLPCALSSSSWCSVCLFLPAKGGALLSASEVVTMLPPTAPSSLVEAASAAALRRLRVLVSRISYSTERCFVLHRPADAGSIKWQREY